MTEWADVDDDDVRWANEVLGMVNRDCEEPIGREVATVMASFRETCVRELKDERDALRKVIDRLTSEAGVCEAFERLMTKKAIVEVARSSGGGDDECYDPDGGFSFGLWVNDESALSQTDRAGSLAEAMAKAALSGGNK